MRPAKTPAEVLDYGIELASWLPAGDTIQSATWTVDAGLTVTASSHTADTAVVWVSGGTPDSRYTATCRVTTAGGRTVERSIVIPVVQKKVVG